MVQLMRPYVLLKVLFETEHLVGVKECTGNQFVTLPFQITTVVCTLHIVCDFSPSLNYIGSMLG